MLSDSPDVVPLAIVLDDTSDSFTDVKGWFPRKADSYIGGSEWVKSSDASTSLTCDFEGTSITFHGLNQTQQAWTVTAILDGQSTQQSTAAGITTRMAYDFMTFSGLEEGSHTIVLEDMTTMLQGEQSKIDYAYAIPGPNTPLRGKVLMVDDTDPAVSYSGSWSTLRDPSQWPQTYNNVTLVPHGNTAHQSQTAGDSFEFSFFGTSVSVYGFDSLNKTGTVTMNFQLDDSPPQSATMVDAGKFKYFESPTISAANHTLRMNITNIEGDLPLLLDYILYTAAFDSLASPGTSGSQPASSGSASPSDSGSAVPSSTPVGSQDGSQGSTGVSTKTVVGATVGTILGLALCIVALLAFRSYRQRRDPESEKPKGPNPGRTDLFSTPLPQRDSPGFLPAPTDMRINHVTPFYGSAVTAGVPSGKQAPLDSPNLGRGSRLIQNNEVAPPAYDFDLDSSAMSSYTTTHR